MFIIVKKCGVGMIKIDKNGEITINGEKLSEITNKHSINTINKTVVIENGKVIKNEVTTNGNDLDFENFMGSVTPAFKQLTKVSKIKCSYCDSIYKSDKAKCPNCGAANNEL